MRANYVNPYIPDLPCAAQNAHICLNMLRLERCYSLHFTHHSEPSGWKLRDHERLRELIIQSLPKLISITMKILLKYVLLITQTLLAWLTILLEVSCY